MQDNVKVSGKWEFNEDVAECFDDMLERSIPGYNTMRELVFRFAKRLTNGRTVIDLGSSLGRSFEAFADDGYSVVSCEISEPMIEHQKETFGNYKNVKILKQNFVDNFPDVKANIILCVLTLQFTPIEYRKQIVKSIYDHLDSGGVFILVEKMVGDTAELDNALVAEYYADKGENGYTNEAIQAKRKSLEGVLVPIPYEWNIDLLKKAGFSGVECFWRYLNFAAIAGIK